jgi:hypothetical protein
MPCTTKKRRLRTVRERMTKWRKTMLSKAFVILGLLVLGTVASQASAIAEDQKCDGGGRYNTAAGFCVSEEVGD